MCIYASAPVTPTIIRSYWKETKPTAVDILTESVKQEVCFGTVILSQIAQYSNMVECIPNSLSVEDSFDFQRRFIQVYGYGRITSAGWQVTLCDPI